ncbi:hypothetical protein ACWOEJ_03235 [Enterococcus eurekensis]|uniref:Uncharacterized protein n=1 Tax=Enterococcus eurekensis TaxID=1159753 RepID=A0ABV9M745_9ENTE
MKDNQEIKRTHTRFPAYSDEEGVKIQRAEKRNLFSSEENWILTEESETPFYSRKTNPAEIKDLRRSNRSTANKAGQSIRQKEELKRHRSNLPDYSKRVEMEVTKTGKKQFFGEGPKQASYLVKEKKSETVPSVKRQYSGRAYFVPKYIPASIIPDAQDAIITENQLLKSMEKPEGSYLLFDTDVTPYQERNDEDPSVQKFASKQSVEDTGEKPKKKKMSLDRSLKGMIEQERDDLTERNYFS